MAIFLHRKEEKMNLPSLFQFRERGHRQSSRQERERLGLSQEDFAERAKTKIETQYPHFSGYRVLSGRDSNLQRWECARATGTLKSPVDHERQHRIDAEIPCCRNEVH